MKTAHTLTAKELAHAVHEYLDLPTGEYEHSMISDGKGNFTFNFDCVKEIEDEKTEYEEFYPKQIKEVENEQSN